MKYRKSNNDGHIDNYCKSCDALEKQDMAMAWLVAGDYLFKFGEIKLVYGSFRVEFK